MGVTDFDRLQLVRERAERREVRVALYTADMFETGNDADAVLRGLKRHP